MATAQPTGAEVRALFRALLREARKFHDYNIREYVKRRSRQGFRQHQSESSPESVAAAFSEGQEMLNVAKRQAVVYSLYAPRVKNIMDIKSKEK